MRKRSLTRQEHERGWNQTDPRSRDPFAHAHSKPFPSCQKPKFPSEVKCAKNVFIVKQMKLIFTTGVCTYPREVFGGRNTLFTFKRPGARKMK